MYARIAKETSDDDFEIDDDPVVSVGIGGAFVSAWIWIPTPEVEAVA